MPGVALVGAVEPDVALESTEKASLGLSSGDVVYDVGASVLVVAELVAEVVFNLVCSIAEDVIGLLVLEAVALVVFDLKVVAFFRTHMGTLGEGDILSAGLSAVAFTTDIGDVVALGGMPGVWSSIYHGPSQKRYNT